MIKVFRFVAVCTISAAFAISSIAWAQSYTTVDYPGATATTVTAALIPRALRLVLGRIAVVSLTV